MKQFILLLLINISFIISNAQPPNNPVFFGGGGDGSSYTNFSIAPVNIFTGSNGDGLAVASNNSIANAVFTGDMGDGSHFASNNAVANNIFSGSEGDGFSGSSNGAISNAIFLGSDGDGFSGNSNNAVSNNIFTGGGGDGWNAVIFPMGPLPVKLLSFTAEHAGKHHLVKWVTTEEINSSHFEIQRSANAKDFVSIGTVAATGGASSGASYHFTVTEPWQGNNFYRLKIVDQDGSISYSNIVLLKNEGSIQLSVYPNPTASLLYIVLPSVNNTTTVPAAIYDMQGKIVLQTILQTGTNNALKVDALAAGTYTIQCKIGGQFFVLRFMKSR